MTLPLSEIERIARQYDATVPEGLAVTVCPPRTFAQDAAQDTGGWQETGPAAIRVYYRQQKFKRAAEKKRRRERAEREERKRKAAERKREAAAPQGGYCKKAMVPNGRRNGWTGATKPPGGDHDATILACVKRKCSVTEVMAETGLSRSGVYKAMRRLGVRAEGMRTPQPRSSA